MNIKDNLNKLREELPDNVELIAISKTFPPEDIMQAYEAGQRVFGESRQQELTPKYEALPKDIEWHMVGHLQRNKVRFLAPFVKLIHSVNSARLLRRIDREAKRNERVIDVLMQVLIADEKKKNGWSREELLKFIEGGEHKKLENIRIRGVMGMATFTDDQEQVMGEYRALKSIFDELREEYFDEEFDTISMGMTGDYKIAIECGSNMVRIGSKIFGGRE